MKRSSTTQQKFISKAREFSSERRCSNLYMRAPQIVRLPNHVTLQH